MTRVALRAQSIENHGESWRPDGLTWVGLEKAIRAFVAKTWRENKGLKHSRVFRRIMNFLLWLEKTKENPFFIVEIFLWFSRVRPYIASYLVWTKIFEVFNAKWSQDKFLIDWTGKYLALGHDARTSLRPLARWQSVCHDLEPNIVLCVSFGPFSIFPYVLIFLSGVFILEHCCGKRTSRPSQEPIKSRPEKIPTKPGDTLQRHSFNQSRKL